MRHPCGLSAVVVWLLVLLPAACTSVSHRTEEADDAFRRGDYARALELYEAAEKRGPGDPLLSQKIETVRSHLRGEREEWERREREAEARRRRREDLMARAREARAAGRPATAVLFERAARAADPSFSGPGRPDSARDRYGLAVAVMPLADGTGGKAPPEAYRKTLIEALREAADGAWLSFTTAPGPETIRVEGRVDALALSAEKRSVSTERMEYVESRSRRSNPEYARLTRELGLVRRRIPEATRELQARRDEVRALEEIGDTARVHLTVSRRYGPYSEAAYYRHLGNARRLEADAGAELDRLTTAEADLRDRLSRTPRILETEKKGRVAQKVTTVTRTGTATATFRILPPDGGPPVTGTVRAVYRATDRTFPGVAKIGLAPDPLEMPGDGVLSSRTLQALAGELARRVRKNLLRYRLPLLDEAKEREEAGDRAGAAERYAAYLLAIGDARPPGRSLAAERVRALLGLTVDGSGVGTVPSEAH